MTIRIRKRESPEIDMGAFSDIAFLLIIFFVLTTTFAKFQGTTVNLPSGAEGESEENEKQITVVLDAGKIHLNDNPENLTIEQLEIKLAALKLGEKKNDMEKMVLIDASDAVIYDTQFKVFTMISKVGGVPAIIDVKADAP